MKQQKGDNIKHFSYFGGKILPNSYQYLGNCQNSGDLRKIRPRYAQCARFSSEEIILNSEVNADPFLTYPLLIMKVPWWMSST